MIVFLGQKFVNLIGKGASNKTSFVEALVIAAGETLL